MTTYLMNRNEIAITINYRLAAAVKIDMEREDLGYHGEQVQVYCGKYRGLEKWVTGTISYYPDSCGWVVSGWGFGISSSFGYEDVMEMHDAALAPRVSDGDLMCVIEDYPSMGQCKVHIMKVVGGDSFCTTICKLEELTVDDEKALKSKIKKILAA